MKRIEAVIFDLDDTLILEWDFINSGMQAVAGYLEEKTARPKEEVYRRLIEIQEENSQFVFNRYLTECSLPLNWVGEMVSIYKNHKPSIALLPDAKQIIHRLRSHGLKIGIITDGDVGTQEGKLNAIGASELFNAVVISDSLGIENRKPSELPYRKCLEVLNLHDYSRTVYVGDNVSKDFITAKKLGMKTFQVVRNRGVYRELQYPEEYQAHYKSSGLEELIEFLGLDEE